MAFLSILRALFWLKLSRVCPASVPMSRFRVRETFGFCLANVRDVSRHWLFTVPFVYHKGMREGRG